MKDQIKIFAPATVSNVACGFDVLGFCLDTIGDEMIIRKTSEKGVFITKVVGHDLPYKTEENVAGVSALAMYNELEPDCGFEIEMVKNIKPGSGIGSSAASAVGSVFGMNELLGRPCSKTRLTEFALKGEALASQAEHADNLAPAMFGGFTLVRSTKPLEVLQIPTPSDLFTTIIHPQIEIKTAESRAILPKEVKLSLAIEQWANVGSLVHALHANDYALIKQSLKDVIVEPHRKQLIPLFDNLKSVALSCGALGCTISGAGPAVFALSKGEAIAQDVAKAFDSVYKNSDLEYKVYVSKINTEGVKTL